MEEVEVLAEEDQIRCLVEVALEAWGGLQEVQGVEEAYHLEEEQEVAYILLPPSYLEEEEQE